MKRARVDSLFVLSVMGCLAGCGGTSDDAGPAAGAGGAGSSGSAGQAALGGAAGNAGSPTTAGSAGVSGGAGNGQAGGAALGCSGAFGDAVPALDETGVLVGSPTLSPDALELLYVRGQGTQIDFRRSLRGSLAASFPAGTAIPELDAACQVGQSRSVDLSPDGLRAYVACYSTEDVEIGAAVLRIADRASLAAPFVVRASMSSVGPSAAISHDELTLFSSSDIEPGAAEPLQFVRGALADAFGSGQIVPGLQGVFLSAPEPSPDGLSLFAGYLGDVVEVRRGAAGEPFGAPSVLVATTGAATQQLGAPEVSQDCRTLLYVNQLYVDGVLSSSLMLARR